MSNTLKQLARRFGYDLIKLKNQPTLEIHLQNVFKKYNIDCVLDVGAHVGQYGKLLRSIGYKGWILSFEPVSKNHVKLVAATRNDKRWKAFHSAIGDRTGTAKINLMEGTHFSSLNIPNEFGTRRFGEYIMPVEQEEICVDTIDNLSGQISTITKAQNWFLKMDTQGHDLSVFKGAKKSLDKIIAMQSELSCTQIYKEIPTAGASLSEYEKSGYVLSGVFSVSRDHDRLTFVEADCVMIKEAKSLSSGE